MRATSMGSVNLRKDRQVFNFYLEELSSASAPSVKILVSLYIKFFLILDFMFSQYFFWESETIIHFLGFAVMTMKLSDKEKSIIASEGLLTSTGLSKESWEKLLFYFNPIKYCLAFLPQTYNWPERVRAPYFSPFPFKSINLSVFSATIIYLGSNRSSSSLLLLFFLLLLNIITFPIQIIFHLVWWLENSSLRQMPLERMRLADRLVEDLQLNSEYAETYLFVHYLIAKC